MKTLMKNSFFNIVYKLASIVFPLIMMAYASRVLLPEGIGVFSSIQNTASYFTALASLGLPVYGTKIISKSNDQDEINRSFSELLILNAIFSLISSIFYCILIASFEEFRNNFSIYLVCGLPIFFNLFNIDWLYQGKEDYKYIAIRSIIVKIISLILIIVFVKGVSDLFIFALIVSLSSVLNYIFNIINSRKYAKIVLRNLKFKKHFKPIFFLALVVILSAIYNKVDITMLSIMKDDTIVGLYSNAHRGIDVILAGCAALTATFLPRLSSIKNNDQLEINKLLNFGFKVITFLVFPACAGLYVIAPQLVLVLFGNDFSRSAETLRIFSFLLLIRVYGDLFCYQLLIAIGKEDKRLWTAILATLVNIILNFILIPKYGNNGAAIASVISELIMNGLLFIYVIRVQKIKINYLKPLLDAVISTMIMGVGIYFINKVNISPIWSVLLVSSTGVFIYGIVNVIMHNDLCFKFFTFIKEKTCR